MVRSGLGNRERTTCFYLGRKTIKKHVYSLEMRILSYLPLTEGNGSDMHKK